MISNDSAMQTYANLIFLFKFSFLGCSEHKNRHFMAQNLQFYVFFERRLQKYSISNIPPPQSPSVRGLIHLPLFFLLDFFGHGLQGWNTATTLYYINFMKTTAAATIFVLTITMSFYTLPFSPPLSRTGTHPISYSIFKGWSSSMKTGLSFTHSLNLPFRPSNQAFLKSFKITIFMNIKYFYDKSVNVKQKMCE